MKFDKKKAMSKPAMKNLHVPLPEPLYRRLRNEAARSGRPATDLAREAIDAWLQKQRAAAIHEAILEYAREVGGTRDDLDPELESASFFASSSRTYRHFSSSRNCRPRQR